ncbi:hypothetical protein LWI29_001129 [Acer saccharum]|uniref:Trichome birefringence-like C-terminal domain-containing protein n=1 Tax=Acer saccharum TaxID=4024 RepID=A0AA39TB20_ACESA|nr:hypothetical protein LWI29_001129 [Acer saccharum]
MSSTAGQVIRSKAFNQTIYCQYSRNVTNHFHIITLLCFLQVLCCSGMGTWKATGDLRSGGGATQTMEGQTPLYNNSFIRTADPSLTQNSCGPRFTLNQSRDERRKLLPIERKTPRSIYVAFFRMQDKTIAFIGDSLGRQQFQSLMCMATGGEVSPEVEDIGREYDLVKHRGSIRPDGWVYRFPKTNTTILYYWSSTLADLVPINFTDPAADVAMHLDRPPAFMRKNLHRFDVLVLNTGHHWNRGKLRANRWVMYVNGKHIEDEGLADLANAKNFTVYSVTRWLDSQLSSHPEYVFRNSFWSKLTYFS